MRTPKQSIWLGSGIGLIAVISGYMVGASQSPVVSVAIPAVFGLVVTTLGFIGSGNIEKRLEPIKEALNKNNLTDAQTTLVSIDSELKKNPDRVGKILVAFSVFYIVGLAFGTYARVVDLYDPPIKRQLPWEQNANLGKPLTVSDAIDWIQLQEELLELGYTREQIASLYAIQLEEWKKPKQSQDNSDSPGNKTEDGSKNKPEDQIVNKNSNRNLSGRIKRKRPPHTKTPILPPPVG